MTGLLKDRLWDVWGRFCSGISYRDRGQELAEVNSVVEYNCGNRLQVKEGQENVVTLPQAAFYNEDIKMLGGD